MRRRQRAIRKKNTGKLLVVGILAIFVLVMMNRVLSLYHTQSRYEVQASEIKDKIEEEKQRTKDLESYADEVKTPEYIESIARSKLGLVYDNEIVFKEKDK